MNTESPTSPGPPSSLVAPEETAVASTRALAAIARKRCGKAVAPADIERLVEDYALGRVSDAVMAAWLATVACKGMTLRETAALTQAYVVGGKRLDLRSVSKPVVDKHSTGGVGDKVSLVVAPMVAACDVAVAKMSGRGLGHAGGTIDKLESIAGLRLDLDADEALAVLRESGMFITGQSVDLAPGDRATYELRNLTGAVESVPLIAASVMSKKIAVGADGLVLDVKAGSGALLPNRDETRALARSMVALAELFGISCRAVITDMSQPLGYAVGNALEVKEALSVLHGERVPNLNDICVAVAALMLQTVDDELSEAEARTKVRRTLESGAALERFERWVAAQGGDPRQIARPDLLPTAPNRVIAEANRAGWIESIDPRAIGMAAVRVGAGRMAPRVAIDHAAGVSLRRQIGDEVAVGEPLAEIHYSSADPSASLALVHSAFVIGPTQPVRPQMIHETVLPPQRASRLAPQTSRI